MSATTAHPLPGRSAPTWGPGRVLALIGGSLLALIALGLVIGDLDPEDVVAAHRRDRQPFNGVAVRILGPRPGAARQQCDGRKNSEESTTMGHMRQP